jgi:hypothetical protein
MAATMAQTLQNMNLIVPKVLHEDWEACEVNSLQPTPPPPHQRFLDGPVKIIVCTRQSIIVNPLRENDIPVIP